jgi:hypothetical protein
MTAGWTAAAVRAHGLVRRRLGPVVARRIAATPDWAQAVAALDGSVYAERVAGTGHDAHDPHDPAAVQRAITDTLIWQVRVLAGWSPPGGTAWARCLLAAAERENIVDRLRTLGPARAVVAHPHALGSLATAWPRLQRAATVDELRRELDGSPWGDPGTDDPGVVRDVLTAGWLCRVFDTVGPQVGRARDWARAGAALLAARILLSGGTVPGRAVLPLSALLGRRVPAARTLDDVLAALPSRAARLFVDVTGLSDLWQAEVALARLVEDDGFALLRRPGAGLDPVVGAVALLGVDAWRLRGALGAAAAGTGPGEVLRALG